MKIQLSVDSSFVLQFQCGNPPAHRPGPITSNNNWARDHTIALPNSKSSKYVVLFLCCCFPRSLSLLTSGASSSAVALARPPFKHRTNQTLAIPVLGLVDISRFLQSRKRTGCLAKESQYEAARFRHFKTTKRTTFQQIRYEMCSLAQPFAFQNERSILVRDEEERAFKSF